MLVDYYEIFARHRMDIGMNTEFKVKLTPKDDKAVYSQSLPKPIHLKRDLIVEKALMHKDGNITVLPSFMYASPIFAQSKPNGTLCLLADLGKINSLIADDYTNNIHPDSTLSDAAQDLAAKSLFCKKTALRLLTVCRWRTNGQWKSLQSFFLAELLPEKELHRVSADWCLPF